MELAIRNRRWNKDSHGHPFPAEVEALTLARCVHLNLLSHPTMWEALKNCSWMEVALRRIYTILYVEDALALSNGQVQRSTAWSMVNHILEVHPSGGLRVPELDNSVWRQAASTAKTMNALKNLGHQKRPNDGRRNKDKTPDKRQ